MRLGDLTGGEGVSAAGVAGEPVGGAAKAEGYKDTAPLDVTDYPEDESDGKSSDEEDADD